MNDLILRTEEVKDEKCISTQNTRSPHDLLPASHETGKMDRQTTGISAKEGCGKDTSEKSSLGTLEIETQSSESMESSGSRGAHF